MIQFNSINIPLRPPVRQGRMHAPTGGLRLHREDLASGRSGSRAFNSAFVRRPCNWSRQPTTSETNQSLSPRPQKVYAPASCVARRFSSSHHRKKRMSQQTKKHCWCTFHLPTRAASKGGGFGKTKQKQQEKEKERFKERFASPNKRPNAQTPKSSQHKPPLTAIIKSSSSDRSPPTTTRHTRAKTLVYGTTNKW